jgi:hypothetical protein
MKPILVVATYSSGSTYFQRAATFWISQLIDNTITNPHDLMNGIVYKEGKLFKEWMSHKAQTYEQIITLLKQSQSPYLARITVDKTMKRKDLPFDFYKYLKETSDVYTSTRDDLFDYGMCTAVRKQTDRPEDKQVNNVHSAEDRALLYSGKTFTVDPNVVIEQAKKYLQYKNWVATNFPNAKEISYKEIEQDIDLVLQRYFPAEQTIEEKFGISISRLTLYQYLLSKEDPAISQFSEQEITGANKIIKIMNQMCESNIMIDTIPVKSTTITDKLKMVSNFNECIDIFNQWAIANNYTDQIVSSQWLEEQIQYEQKIYGESV